MKVAMKKRALKKVPGAGDDEAEQHDVGLEQQGREREGRRQDEDGLDRTGVG